MTKIKFLLISIILTGLNSSSRFGMEGGSGNNLDGVPVNSGSNPVIKEENAAGKKLYDVESNETDMVEEAVSEPEERAAGPKTATPPATDTGTGDQPVKPVNGEDGVDDLLVEPPKEAEIKKDEHGGGDNTSDNVKPQIATSKEGKPDEVAGTKAQGKHLSQGEDEEERDQIQDEVESDEQEDDGEEGGQKSSITKKAKTPKANTVLNENNPQVAMAAKGQGKGNSLVSEGQANEEEEDEDSEIIRQNQLKVNNKRDLLNPSVILNQSNGNEPELDEDLIEEEDETQGDKFKKEKKEDKTKKDPKIPTENPEAPKIVVDEPKKQSIVVRVLQSTVSKVVLGVSGISTLIFGSLRLSKNKNIKQQNDIESEKI
jgi:hypothetical protein